MEPPSDFLTKTFKSFRLGAHSFSLGVHSLGRRGLVSFGHSLLALLLTGCRDRGYACYSSSPSSPEVYPDIKSGCLELQVEVYGMKEREDPPILPPVSTTLFHSTVSI